MGKLNVALIGGPAYDGLYARIRDFETRHGIKVDVRFTAPHPQLNERLAREYAAGTASYDVISTHSKYAPSQADWLLPLDEWITSAEQTEFLPRSIELAKIDGRLMQIPRNVDVRLLHYRTDLGIRPPSTWDEFRETARRAARPPDLYGTTFPGRHSGLFGTWYELLASAGGRLVDDELRPAFAGEAGEWALGFLHQLHAVDRVTPRDLPAGHFEDTAALFRSGRCAMIAEWPGYYGLLKDPALSAVAKRFDVARYPAGPFGRRVYSGSHSFAIPRSVRDLDGALALLRFFTSEESQVMEGMMGAVVPRIAAWEKIKHAYSSDGRRMELLELTIREDMLVPPKLNAFPAIEDALWISLQAGVTGELTVRQALERAHTEVVEIMEGVRA